MLTDHGPLFTGQPTPPTPAPRRHRCPTCHAGFAPVSASQRIADQRAKAGRDYAAEWAAFVAAEPARVAVVVACARQVAALPRPTMDAVWLAVAAETGAAIDHNLRAPAARWLMATHADLAGVFVTREKAGSSAAGSCVSRRGGASGTPTTSPTASA